MRRDPATGACTVVLSAHSEGVTCGTWSPNGKLVATGSTDQTLILWNSETGEALWTWTKVGGEGCARLRANANYHLRRSEHVTWLSRRTASRSLS